MSGKPRYPPPMCDLPAVSGAYILLIDLARPLTLDISALGPATLPPGRYAYCGSASGPGGIRARVGRHLKPDKRPHWHIDRLTGPGRVVLASAYPDGHECTLFARLLSLPGVTVPVPGFGSTDCRHCPSHLAAVPAGFTPL